jgi:hypothetical protein
MFVLSPIHDARAAPPDQQGDTRSSRAAGVSVPGGVVRPLSCRIEGATATVPGANLYVRNESNAALPVGTKIQWKAIPETAVGVYTLGAPLPPGESKMLAKVYDKSCTATIVP